MSEHDKLLDQTARQIEKLTAEAFAELMRRIRAGEDPQSAIQAIMQTWEPAYRERLAEAFSATLARFVGPDELRDYPIGEMALSPRLYAHAATTTAVVRDIVQRHAAGFQDARQLTLQLFEGYGFRKDEPLKISPKNPKLPKYLRREILTDPDLAGQLARHFTKVQAATLKTPALRAAYLEAIDAMEKGRGSKALERKLEVAYQERMRYHANRIAQTELHRAWMDKQAEELMADDTVEVVQFKMSGTHPRTDICDLFAKQDAYGLGPGLYPKEHAPRPPLHPFCRCGLISKRLISAKGAQFKPEAHRVYLRQVMAEEGVSKAAQAVGSRAKLQAVLRGAEPLTVVNAGRPAAYHLRMLSDPYALPSLGTLPERTEWRGDETVGIVASESTVKKHPFYGEAKTGGTVAATRLVMDILDDAWLAIHGRSIQNSTPILVGVHAVEGMSTNVIGPMLSQWLGMRLDLPVDDNIVQINRVGHTGSSGWHRLATPALFAGAVMPGRTYWLADDFVGQGGTLANLRGYIESKGGRVVGYTALTGRSDSSVLGLNQTTLSALRKKHGTLENWWQQQFGFGFDRLTESEARYLLRAEDADTIRNRLASGR